MSDQKTDIQQTAVDRLPAWSQENLQFAALIRGQGRIFQYFEDVLFDIKGVNDIDNAVGEAQNVQGRHLELKREGLSDDQYRQELKGRYQDLQRSGEPESLIALYKELTTSIKVKYEDFEEHQEQINYLSAFVTVRPDSTTWNQAATQMRRAKQGGQGLSLGIVEDVSFKLGNTSGLFNSTGLQDIKTNYPPFRLGNTDGTFSKSGLANNEGGSNARFYDSEADPDQTPQTNITVVMAFLIYWTGK